MIYRDILDTGIRCSVLGLGCARLGSFASGLGGRSATRLLHEAFDLGITFFDTADSYGQGESERLLGRTFRGGRDKIVIASKVGYEVRKALPLMSFIKPIARPILKRILPAARLLRGARALAVGRNFRPDYIVLALESSLKRLQTDYIDFYLLHDAPAGTIANAEVLESLESLKRSGKIRQYGVSCASPDAGRAALLEHGVRAIGLATNPLSMPANEAVVEMAAQAGVGVFATEALGAGALAPWLASSGNKALVPDLTAAQRALLDQVSKDAAESEISLPQALVRFALSQKGTAVALVGTSRLDHLRDVARATDGYTLRDSGRT